MSGLLRYDACVGQTTAIASLRHRVLLLLVWLSSAASMPRKPRGGSPGSRSGTRSFRPEGPGHPYAPPGRCIGKMTASRRSSRYCLGGSSSERILHLIAARCQLSAWEFRVSGSSHPIYHIADMMCSMGAWVLQAELRGVVHHCFSKVASQAWAVRTKEKPFDPPIRRVRSDKARRSMAFRHHHPARTSRAGAGSPHSAVRRPLGRDQIK